MNFLIDNFNNFGFLFILTLNFFVLYLTNFIFLKNKFCLDKFNSSYHKKYFNKENVPLTGGFLILFSTISLGYYENIVNLFTAAAIFLVGILSDLRKLNSTHKRFIIQILIIFIFLINNTNLHINEIRLHYFDYLLNNYQLISITFTCFCILILVNGSNFIDGTNLQCSGYFLAILLVLILISLDGNLLIDEKKINILLLSLIIFIIFNFLNKSFLGDGGTYYLSFLVGILLIEFFLKNNVSPYFIALLLWYPAFENLFSIIRRMFYQNKKIDEPDNFHLHHLIFLKINHKFKNNYLKKNATGVIIILYNFLIFLIGKSFLYSSIIQIYLILFSILLYTSIYWLIIRKNINK